MLNKKIYLAFIGIVLLGILIVFTFSPSEYLRSLNVDWENKTIGLINRSQNPDGGFGDIDLVGKPTLYDTYYFLQTARLLGLPSDSKHEKNTIDWILAKYQKSGYFYQEDSDNRLYDTYYSVKILELLNCQIPNKNDIAKYILSLQNKNGSFTLSGQKSGTEILSTLFALELISDLKIKFNYSTVQQWLQNELQRKDNDIYKIASLYKIAPMIGFDIDKSIHGELVRFNTEVNRMKVNGISGYDLFLLYDLNIINNSYDGVINIPKSLVDQINEHHNKDGGFGGNLTEISDSKGTYLALYLLNHYGKQNYKHQELTELISLHKITQGGFSGIIYSPSTFSTTAVSVEILRSLGKEPKEKDKILKYCNNNIQSFNSTKLNPMNLNDLYYSILCMKALNADVPIDKQLISTFISVLKDIGDINEKNVFFVKRSIDILKELNYQFGRETAKNISIKVNKWLEVQKKEKIEYKKFSSYIIGIDILNSLGTLKSFPKEDYIRYFNSLSKTDGGFSIDDWSDIYSTYHVLQSLSYLDAKPNDTQKIQKWLFCNRLLTGGYRMKTSDSSVSLLGTYFGVKTEKLLAN